MRKYLILFFLFALLLPLAGCTGPRLGEEFALSPGDSVVINSEGLRIKFLEVTEDSRCPQGVTCIWAGQVSCLVEVGDTKKTEQLKLTQTGGTSEFSVQTYGSYDLHFNVEPYPVAGQTIEKDDYQLVLIVGKTAGK
ncbi:MAG: hypothetical protein PHR56_05465 [Dehalococcoidales bacterium]|nr:hypothetical protein [Dehalococcoidales bacterium]